MAGKNEALFKPFLFADQDLEALLAGMTPRGGALAEAVGHLRAGNAAEAEVVLGSAILTAPGEATPWHRIVLALAQTRRGNTTAATRTLRGLAGSSKESRVRLWCWQALRRLGAAPAEAEARKVEGVVVEVEGGHGVETLAAYADGTARYLLATGAKVVWDAPDARLERPVADVIAGAAPVLDLLQPGRLPGEPGAGTARMTVLSPSGPGAADEPLEIALTEASRFAPLFRPATTLMQKIVALAGW